MDVELELVLSCDRKVASQMLPAGRLTKSNALANDTRREPTRAVVTLDRVTMALVILESEWNLNLNLNIYLDVRCSDPRGSKSCELV